MPRNPLRSRLAQAGGVVLLPVVLLLAAAPKVFFAGENFVFRDLLLTFRPSRALFVRLVSESGGLPLWNPWLSSGQPFAADPNHGVFHPITWLFALLPFEWAFRLTVAIPIVVTFLGMRHLLRTLGRSEVAALYGATVWAFGGFFLSVVNLLVNTMTLFPLPYLLSFVVRLGRGGERRDAAGAALAFGLMCLGGEPSVLLATAMILPFVSLGSLRRADASPDSKPAASRFASQVGAIVVGAAIGGATLLPAADLFRGSERSTGFELAGSSSEWSLHPLRVAELVAPRALGHFEPTAPPGAYWGASLFPERGWPLLFSLYPGIAALPLALLALVTAWRKNLGWIGAALLSVLLSLGRHLPPVDALRRMVPLLSGIRFPERFLVAAFVALVVLAALGLDLLLAGEKRGRRSLLLFAAAVGSLGVAVAAFALGGRVPLAGKIAPPIAAIFAADALRVALLAGLFGAIVFLARRRPALAAAILLGLTAADLVLVGRPLLLSEPSSRLAAVPPIWSRFRSLGADGPIFDFTIVEPGREAIAGVFPTPMPALWGVATTLDADYSRTQPRFTRRATELFFEAIDEDPSLAAPLLARRGVAGVIRAGAPGPDGRRETRLRVPTSRQPFAFCPDRILVAPDEAGWLRSVKELGPAAATAAVLASPPPPGLAPVPAGCRPMVAERRAGRVAVDVDAAGPGPSLLAVNQSWDEGWSARLDGAPTPLLRSDVSLQAVVVPAGHHRVELDYRNRWVTLGILLSAAGLAVTLGLALAGRRSIGPK